MAKLNLVVGSMLGAAEYVADHVASLLEQAGHQAEIHNPASLAERIAGFESSGQFPAARSLQDWHWIGWREASLQLVEGVCQGIERAHAAAALAAPADARRT